MKSFVCAALAALSLSAVISAQSITFTGNVAADFAGAFFVADPLGDVGLPVTLTGAQSGWDIQQLALAYDAATDTLFVGIDCAGIVGDADGDGDGGTTSPGLGGIGGSDIADFGGTESFTFGLDLSGDGTVDVIAGLPLNADLNGAMGGYQVALFSPFGTLFAPFVAFGTALPANTGTVFMSPNASAPDLEFTITNFSALTNMFTTPGQSSFGIHAFLGSLADAGIGEDFLPGTFTLPTSTDVFPCFPIPNELRVLTGPTAVNGGFEVTTRYGQLDGYGCCVLYSLFCYTPGFPVNNLPGAPTIFLGLPNQPMTVTAFDSGIPPLTGNTINCKDQSFFVPNAVPSGTKIYAQFLSYPPVPAPGLLYYASNKIEYCQP